MRLSSRRRLISIGIFSLIVAATVLIWGCLSQPAPAAFSLPVQRHGTVKPLVLPPALPIATGYTTEDYFATGGGPAMGFDESICTAFPPGEKDRIFVVTKTGLIEVITNLSGKNGPPKRSIFMDINPYLRSKKLELGQEKEWGILGLAFHPKFKENGYFYITYDFLDTESGEDLAFDRLARFSVSKSDPNKADMSSEVPLITQIDNTPNHNGGCVAFNDSDGYLYYSMGDDGYPRDASNNARWVDRNFFAALYRLDVDRKPGSLEPNPHSQASKLYPSAVDKDPKTGKANYAIPADNPFIGITKYLDQTVDPKKVRTEIFAHGLRNPWRFSFDSVTGRLFLADVGEDTYEEVDIIEKGKDYGWPYREGPMEGPRSNLTPPDAKLVEPIYYYQHEAGNVCITGGFVYHGDRMPELNGSYIFADYLSGRVGAIKEKDGKWGPPITLTENVRNIVNIGPDPVNGDILLTRVGPGVGMEEPPGTNSNGQVLRLVRSGTTGTPPPAKLSQIGAFTNLKTLAPVDGLVPYEPNVTFWSDYADKQRWFMIPDAKDTIKFDATGNWKFPPGMVWVKHFDMEMTRGDPSTRRRLETRFLVKTADGVYGITYKWRPDNSDADLVPDTGLNEELSINDHGTTIKQTWHYPSQGECLRCHTDLAGGPLGFNTWQLNNSKSSAANFIGQLAAAGYFSADSKIPDVASLGAYAKADDASASLEWRARSYLGANCVQCHQPGGQAQGTWDARPSTPFDTAGILNGLVNSQRGDPNNKVIAPGDPAHSMIFKRVEAKDAPRMPPLASNELDLGAQNLLRDWITSLKH